MQQLDWVERVTDARIRAMYAKGYTLQTIATKHSVTVARVKQAIGEQE